MRHTTFLFCYTTFFISPCIQYFMYNMIDFRQNKKTTLISKLKKHSLFVLIIIPHTGRIFLIKQ